MTKTGAMKHINLILLILFAGVLSTATFAQTTDNAVVLGGDLSKNQLRININSGGTYCVYRCVDDINYDRQFYATNSHLFAIRIGNTTFSSGGTTLPSSSNTMDGVTIAAFDKIEDVGTVDTTGVNQEVTKQFTGTYNGNTFAVTLRIIYNTSSLDYFVKQATLDLRNIPDGTSVIYAYGWDIYVNGNDFGYAYLVPNLLSLNDNPTETNLHLTTAQVQSLRMVGAGNSYGDGSLIAFFPIGRSFDRAYSAHPFYHGYCFNMPALTPGNGSPTTTANPLQYRMQFGPYGSGPDNSAGVGYDHIPAGEITEIKTGFTFTSDLDGELDYLWNNSKDYTANIGDDVSLQLNYLSYNDAVLSNVGFRVDFTGLPIRSACSLTGFTGGTSTGAIGNEFYELTGALVAAFEKASVTIPVHVTRAGQWIVDGSSITNMTQTLPLGMPAKLTVSTTVSLVNAENVNFLQGSSKDITVQFPDGVIATGDVTIDLSYSGATSSFSSLPASVTIPEGKNSAKFTVTASPTGMELSEVTVTLSETDQEYVTVASPSQVKLIIWDPDKIGFTINDINYKEWDGKSFCDLTGSLKIKAYPDYIAEELIQWTLIIDGTTSSNPPVEKEFDLPVNTGKMITVILTVDDREYKASFLLGRASLVWTPENNSTNSEKTNWNNPKNWTPAYIPSTCSDVYIPGNSSHYPTLNEGTVAECNDIHFIQGAELGRPDLLKYDRSYIQLNFGLIQSNQEKDANKNLVTNSAATTYDRMKYSAAVSTPLARERWYMLSSPLQGTVTSDLAFGGFPLTFLRKFKPTVDTNTSFSTGQWTASYTSMTETLSATEGFAFSMYGIKDDLMGSMESGSFNDLNNLKYMPYRKDKNYGLKETNGILELPFFADSTNLYAHRTQLYNPNKHQSTFYKIDDGRGYGSVFNNIFDSLPVTMNREANNGNYRFIAEERTGNEWKFKPMIEHSGEGIGGDEDFMVGNPYMSSINMVNFLNDNAATLQQQFKIWNGEGFITYMIDEQGVISVDPDDGSGSISYVAPLQGFFLKTLSNYNYDANNSVAKFNVSNISVTRPEGAPFTLRSGKVEENILRIQAENNTSKSYMLIGYKENASNGFKENEDTKKLFSPFDYVPEIYALVDRIPVDIHFINNEENTTIPLGIKTGQTGEIRLTFTGINNYNKALKIELIDAKENRTVDLTGKSDYTYTYNHTENGILNGRFSLRFGKSMTGLPEINTSDALKVYGDSQGIYVITPSSDPVQQVVVYDFQGRKIYENTSGAGYYPLRENLSQSLLIVKVITKDQVKTVKLHTGY